jgi:Mrp family chromosome partitioning ATPase
MNDMSNIPGPDGEDEKDSAKKGSMIERAAGSRGLGGFALPPVPEKLAGAKVAKAPVKRRSSPVEDAPPPAASAVAAPVPVAEPRPAVAPELAPEAAAPEPVMAQPTLEPVEFRGDRYPIDRERLAESGMLVPGGKVTALLEEFRIVKRKLLTQAAELRKRGAGHSAQRILVSSPHPGEGKTFCSVNLALSMAAEKESEVLLVDADFAKPSVLEVLGLPGSPGLMDALIDERADVADLVLRTDIPGLNVLPCGSTSVSDSEFLSSSRTPRVLDRLTEGAPHRMVIFDTSPALAASPAAELAKYVAQAVMVVRADETGQGALEDAIELLSACPNVQLLLNAAQFSPSGRRFGDYGYRG